MKKVKHIYEFLDKIAPFKYAADFDNVGLIIGNKDIEVRKAILSLDITKEVILEAKNENASLIISHHPVIFKPLKGVNFDDPIALLINYNINAICAHTNLDIAKEGVNFQLAKALGLSSLAAFAFENSHPYGIIGSLNEKVNFLEFAKLVKSRLKCDGLRYTENLKEIKKVAVCSGAGGCFIEEAVNKGVDAFLTGEIKHSQILKANHYGINIMDVGHFKSENVVIKPLKQKLESEFCDVEFKISESFTDKIKYL